MTTLGENDFLYDDPAILQRMVLALRADNQVCNAQRDALIECLRDCVKIMENVGGEGFVDNTKKDAKALLRAHVKEVT
jgi:hypothetical protein